jgi:hypothetical protein
MIPLVVLPLVVDASPAAEGAFLAVDHLIWAVFAGEYAIKPYLAPDRRRFVAHHVPDLVIVLVPMLRPLRVLRSAWLLRRSRSWPGGDLGHCRSWSAGLSRLCW